MMTEIRRRTTGLRWTRRSRSVCFWDVIGAAPVSRTLSRGATPPPACLGADLGRK